METRDAKQHSITDCAVSIGTRVLSIIEKIGEACENKAKTDHGVGEPGWKLYRFKGCAGGAGCVGMADAYSVCVT